MSRVCILNWTAAFHAGSAAVCESIEGLLSGHEIVERVTPGQYASEDFSGADVVLCNAEGTIHHGRPLGEILVSGLRRAQSRGLPTGIVNATWQDNPNEWAEVARRAEFVSVREHRSAVELKRQGVEGVHVFADLSLGVLRRPTIPGPHAGEVVLGSQGASGLSSLWKRLEDRYGAHRVTLRGDRNRPPHPHLQAVAAELSGAACYLTGEYHGLYAAAAAGIGVIAYPSNSWKIESTVGLYGMRARGGPGLADWIWAQPRMLPRDLDDLLCAA